MRRWWAKGSISAWWYIVVMCCLVLPGFRNVPAANAEVAVPNNDEEIVYLDSDRVIRVYDPEPSYGSLQVEWASPDGGWGNFVLGDVTGDGDMEIIAIRAEDNGGRLTIFDPVAQDSPIERTQLHNGVPWAILYDLPLPVAPRLLAVGEFDTSNDVVEILYSLPVGEDDERFIILRSTGEGAPGTEWTEQLSWVLENRWTAVATGNVYLEDAIDEIGLVSFGRGELALYRISPEVRRVFRNVNREHRWRGVAFGQFVNVNNDGDELAAIRDADFPIASAWVFRYDGNTMVDQLGEQYSPSPLVVFFADISGNGDEELVLLREARPELGPRPRLIVRDGNNNDSIAMREDLLDGDNAYRGGDAGDIDGDGRDEIVLVRNNRIRIYEEPQSSTAYTLIERFTDGSTVRVGNLDTLGLAARSRLTVSQRQSSATLQPGQRSSTRSIEIYDETRGDSLSFNVTVRGAQDWIEVNPISGTTPETLSITFNAAGIDPGSYRGTLEIATAAGNVDNSPILIDLALTVERVVTASPASIDFTYFPCEMPLEPDEQLVELSASRSISYTAQIEGNPGWVSVAPPEAGTLPESVRVSLDPERVPANVVSADLLIIVDLPNEPGVVNRFPIHFACTPFRLLMPTTSGQ